MKLNEKIYKCRRKAGLSQEALAEKVGVSRQAVSKWEVGTAVPEIDKIAALSDVFGVTTDWLIKESADNDNSEEESEEENTPADDESADGNKAQSSENTAFRHNSGYFSEAANFLGRQIKKYGWLTGVYVAVSSGGVALLGIIAKVIVNAMVSGFSNATDSMMNSFDGFGYSSPGIMVEGDIPPEVLAQLQDEFAGNYGGQILYDSVQGSSDVMIDTFASSNPVSIAANIMIFIGVIGIIAGVILALWLKSKGKSDK